MPTYEYQCKLCGHQFEIIRKITDTSEVECPKCKKIEVERLLSAPNIQFKGTGWYVTDYKDKKDKSRSGQSNKDSGGETKESKTSESTDSSSSSASSTDSKSSTDK